MTVDREGDGRIREELESLGGRLEGSDGQHIGTDRTPVEGIIPKAVAKG